MRLSESVDADVRVSVAVLDAVDVLEPEGEAVSEGVAVAVRLKLLTDGVRAADAVGDTVAVSEGVAVAVRLKLLTDGVRAADAVGDTVAESRGVCDGNAFPSLARWAMM